MKKKLTDKQEKFAQAVVETSNHAEAYRIAYDVKEGTKQETVANNACKLMTDTNIAARVEEIREGLRSRNRIDKDYLIEKHRNMVDAWEKLMKLGDINSISKADKDKFYMLREMVKGSDYRGSLAELAKLLGEYAPTKTENKTETKDTSHKTDWGS